MDLDWCVDKLRDKISSIDWEAAKEDVRRFVKVAEQPSVNLWSRDLFISQLEKMKKLGSRNS